MQCLKATTVTVFALAISACSGGSLPVRQMYESERCAVSVRGLYIARSGPELLRIMTPTRIDSFTAEPQSDLPDWSAGINFESGWAVVVALGQMPSPGYGLSLTDTEARLEEGVLTLPVKFEKPDPDAFHAQVMTTPCLVLNLPRNDYKTIVAGDMTTDVNDN